nr:MAG TPA: hypothetical protein [Caudoviricetes sp.]
MMAKSPAEHRSNSLWPERKGFYPEMAESVFF